MKIFVNRLNVALLQFLSWRVVSDGVIRIVHIFNNLQIKKLDSFN